MHLLVALLTVGTSSSLNMSPALQLRKRGIQLLLQLCLLLAVGLSCLLSFCLLFVRLCDTG